MIGKKVITMATTKKHMKVGSACIFDSELIYSKVMCMMNSHDLNLKDVFSHELTPVPTSTFMGEM